MRHTLAWAASGDESSRLLQTSLTDFDVQSYVRDVSLVVVMVHYHASFLGEVLVLCTRRPKLYRVLDSSGVAGVLFQGPRP